MKVCHLTSVHSSKDTRIFFKECRGLAKAGYDVTLIAIHDKLEPETSDGVKIVPFPPIKNRFSRILFSPLRMFFMARKEKAKIYHFHDPELIVAGFLLKLTGATVIFDVHENIAMQIKIKHYLPLASLFSRLFKPINYISARCFPLILAENSYEDIYKRYTRRYEIILNMPDIDFLEPHYLPDRDGPLAWEPGGEDFLSPCLEEAALMARILPGAAFRAWLEGFLPGLAQGGGLAHGGRTMEGEIVHLALL